MRYFRYVDRIAIRPPLAFDEAGLVLGSHARFEQSGRLVCDSERFTGLLTIALGQSPSARSVSAIARGLASWQAGDTALANLRLVFSGLPCLDAPQDLQRLKAAEILFDAGLTADHVAGVLGLDGSRDDLGKDVASEPRVPAGNGRQSGEWTSFLWSHFAAWLDEDVPVYDQDTGRQVGTQSRARAIATSPLAVGIAGTAAFLAGEAALPEAASVVPDAPEPIPQEALKPIPQGAPKPIGPETTEPPDVTDPPAEETDTLSDFARRYLSTSGGRLGNTTTRQQLYEIARPYAKSNEYVRFRGDGEAGEEYIRGVGPGTKGGTYVDFTATRVNGSSVRIQTIDTYADGITPMPHEINAAGRIRAAFPNDELLMIPKRRP